MMNEIILLIKIIISRYQHIILQHLHDNHIIMHLKELKF